MDTVYFHIRRRSSAFSFDHIEDKNEEYDSGSVEKIGDPSKKIIC